VVPKDTFPPAAPLGIVAAVQPGATPGSAAVELSWSINVEPDLTGYRVYRSEQEGARGTLLTPDLLPSPAYRDNSVQTGQRYWYTVTAVDRAGNESTPSPAVAVEVAQLSR
jgi:fibronectin type 3 domain-containing protein